MFRNHLTYVANPQLSVVVPSPPDPVLHKVVASLLHTLMTRWRSMIQPDPMLTEIIILQAKHQNFQILKQKDTTSTILTLQMHQLDCQQIYKLYFCFRGMILRCDTLVPRFIPAIPGQQCQFKCRTNLGCLRRLFRVTILEDEV
ncbi:Hypothetical_protein [Hexamita inflata]|uniref:Hypothetical_protein n=1 Tax=Hexamita inflata TaxID=28002 RepID=A0AA86UWI7_9EUKA|nr:Hypothetical protein HINF_LOCUS55096 [Hexamita inflata]